MQKSYAHPIGELPTHSFLDETYGTIVAVKHKNGVNELPLCDLEATEANAETSQLVEDYVVWFANR